MLLSGCWLDELSVNSDSVLAFGKLSLDCLLTAVQFVSNPSNAICPAVNNVMAPLSLLNVESMLICLSLC